MGLDVIIHSLAGILSLILGAAMMLDLVPWARDGFSIMMVITFVSAILISWCTASWVRGHFLAMTPVLGILLGYMGVSIGFDIAFGLLCLALGHFIFRGFFKPPSPD